MKAIFFIWLIWGLVKPVDHNKSVNNKIIQYETLADSSLIFIKNLSTAPISNLPYGSKNILSTYPAQWNFGENKYQNPSTVKVQNEYDKLDSFFYTDVDNSDRLTVEASASIVKKYCGADVLLNKESMNKTIEVKVKRLQVSSAFKTFSLAFNADRSCDGCEYITRQTQNVLLNVDKQNKVIDKLIIASVIGNDIGSKNKFFYIDKNKTIHLKSFANNEVKVSYLKYEKYTVGADGKFVKLK